MDFVAPLSGKFPHLSRVIPRARQVLPLEVRDGYGLVVEVALGIGTANVLQDLELFPLLHPLRHAVNAQLAADVDQMLHQDTGILVGVEVVDDALVNLQLTQLQAGENGQVAVLGPKVVQGEAVAVPHNLPADLLQDAPFHIPNGLGDLQLM